MNCRNGSASATIEDGSRTFNTALVATLELGFMLDVAETMIACALRREESRGAHQRTDFPARDDERFLAHSMVSRDQAGAPRIDYLPVTITRWPPRRTGLRKVSGMPDTITMQVTRYRPDVDSAPTIQEYAVPLRKEWAVLDGLNYIKDRLDGTLSFRWSCRMGICGSCGMMVNGDPALTCGAFLTDYAPGPVRVEPLVNFPVIRDLVVSIDDFMRKLPDRQAMVGPRRLRRVSTTWSSCRRRPTGRVQAIQHVHQLHALLLRRVPVTPRSRTSSARRRSRSPSGTTSTPATRAHTSGWMCSPAHDGVWACTYVGECTSACPKGVDPAGAIQRYKLTAATKTLRSFLFPKAAR